MLYLTSFVCRFLKPLVADVAVVSKCHLSALYTHEKGRLFAQLVDLLQFYEGFEIDDHDGTQLSDHDVLLAHYSRLQAFQLLAFKKIPKVHIQIFFAICSYFYILLIVLTYSIYPVFFLVDGPCIM